MPTLSQKIILTGIFEINGRNPGVGLELMICIFKLKKWLVSMLFVSLFVYLLVLLFFSGLKCFYKSNQMVETYTASFMTGLTCVNLCFNIKKLILY